MEITLKSHKRRVKKKINKDHYWYDVHQKKLLHGKGGKMIFVYDSKSKRNIPRIVDDEAWTHEDSYEDICKWIDGNKNKFNIDIVNIVPGKYINIDISLSDMDAVLEDLYHHKIISDYSESDYLKEKRGTKSRYS